MLSENQYRYLDLLKACLSDSIYFDGLDLPQDGLLPGSTDRQNALEQRPCGAAEHQRLSLLAKSRSF